jgi:aspartate/methionine/tyrosine aminotransferase
MHRLPMRESVIRRTTIRCAREGAVNLSQGFPDDDTSPEMKQFAREAIEEACHQYTDPWGAPALRRAVARKLARFNGLRVDPDRQIVVTCGATEGMMIAMEALIERGAALLTFAPMYENYVLQSIAAGLELRILELREPDFSFTREELERLWTPRVQAVLLSNPCNPTGKVFTRAELQALVDFASAHDLLIFADETYEYLVWEPHRHLSIATLPGAAERTVTVISAGKTYSVTGWRVGYVVADEPLTNELRKMHDFHTVTAPHPFQIAVARAMDELPESYYARQRDSFAERKRILAGALDAAGLTYYDPGGAYFLWCGYDALSAEDDHVFAERLLAETKVAGVAGSVFYPRTAENPRRLRFTFSKTRPTIEEAARRLLALRR